MATKHLTKQQRDNRANQLNPNNPAYYKSRQGNQKKASKPATHTRTIVRTEVVHHHHYKPTSLFDLIFG